MTYDELAAIKMLREIKRKNKKKSDDELLLEKIKHEINQERKKNRS